ncbi:MAG: hypothetical protein KF729_24500 [Sandaracinaceae bacterium]|nr:hypothetical protein [Sandaracinaceae bacterium]
MATRGRAGRRWVSALALWLSACGGSGSGAAIQPRYDAASLSATRYHTVLVLQPSGRPGRTISAASTVAVQRAGAGFDVSVEWSPVHVAGEGGSLAQAPGEARARFTLDARRRMSAAPVVEGDDAAHALARALAEELVLPEHPVAPGQTWPLPPVTRAAGEATITIERVARLGAVVDGVAHVEVTGQSRGARVELAGVAIDVEATLAQSFRMRVADAAIVEMRSTSELARRTAVGRVVDRESAHVVRVLGAPPAPSTHAPAAAHAGPCAARLSAMAQRLERTPRGVDLDATIAANVAVPVRPTGEPIDEPGPVLAGVDEETLLGAAGGADLVRTVAVYVMAPEAVADRELRRWLAGVVAPGIELRRVVRGQVHPPSPAAPPEVEALARRLRGAGSIEPWRAEVRALLALCDEALAAFEAAEALPAAERARASRQGILRGMTRCGCDATDLVRLERTLDLRFGGPELGWEPME